MRTILLSSSVLLALSIIYQWLFGGVHFQVFNNANTVRLFHVPTLDIEVDLNGIRANPDIRELINYNDIVEISMARNESKFLQFALAGRENRQVDLSSLGIKGALINRSSPFVFPYGSGNSCTPRPLVQGSTRLHYVDLNPLETKMGESYLGFPQPSFSFFNLTSQPYFLFANSSGQPDFRNPFYDRVSSGPQDQRPLPWLLIPDVYQTFSNGYQVDAGDFGSLPDTSGTQRPTYKGNSLYALLNAPVEANSDFTIEFDYLFENYMNTTPFSELPINEFGVHPQLLFEIQAEETTLKFYTNRTIPRQNDPVLFVGVGSSLTRNFVNCSNATGPINSNGNWSGSLNNQDILPNNAAWNRLQVTLKTNSSSGNRIQFSLNGGTTQCEVDTSNLTAELDNVISSPVRTLRIGEFTFAGRFAFHRPTYYSPIRVRYSNLSMSTANQTKSYDFSDLASVQDTTNYSGQTQTNVFARGVFKPYEYSKTFKTGLPRTPWHASQNFVLRLEREEPQGHTEDPDAILGDPCTRDYMMEVFDTATNRVLRQFILRVNWLPFDLPSHETHKKYYLGQYSRVESFGDYLLYPNRLEEELQLAKRLGLTGMEVQNYLFSDAHGSAQTQLKPLELLEKYQLTNPIFMRSLPLTNASSNNLVNTPFKDLLESRMLLSQNFFQNNIWVKGGDEIHWTNATVNNPIPDVGSPAPGSQNTQPIVASDHYGHLIDVQNDFESFTGSFLDAFASTLKFWAVTDYVHMPALMDVQCDTGCINETNAATNFNDLSCNTFFSSSFPSYPLYSRRTKLQIDNYPVSYLKFPLQRRSNCPFRAEHASGQSYAQVEANRNIPSLGVPIYNVTINFDDRRYASGDFGPSQTDEFLAHLRGRRDEFLTSSSISMANFNHSWIQGWNEKIFAELHREVRYNKFAPLLNRFFAGPFIAANFLEGIYIQYQSNPSMDLFDASTPFLDPYSNQPTTKNNELTSMFLPGDGKPIETLNLMSLNIGINDMRLFALFDHLLKKIEDNHQCTLGSTIPTCIDALRISREIYSDLLAEQRANPFLHDHRFNGTSDFEMNNDFSRNGRPGLTPKMYENLIQQVQERILELYGLL